MSDTIQHLTSILGSIIDLRESHSVHVRGALYVFNVPGDGPDISDRDRARTMVRPKVSYAHSFKLRKLMAGTYQAIDPDMRFQVQFAAEHGALWELVMQDTNPDMQATEGFNHPYLRLDLRDFKPYGEARIYAPVQRVREPPSSEDPSLWAMSD